MSPPARIMISITSAAFASKKKRRSEEIGFRMNSENSRMTNNTEVQVEAETNPFWSILKDRPLQQMLSNGIRKIIQQVMISGPKKVDLWEQNSSPIKCIPFTMLKRCSIVTIMERDI
jgi:hypothetical protein